MATAKQPARKQPAAKQAHKPAAQKRQVDAKPAQEEVKQAPAAPQIPYHYVATFEVERMTEEKDKDGKDVFVIDRLTTDGVLTVEAPIVDQSGYENLKRQMVNHFGLTGVRSVLIANLTRLDAVQLLARPVQA